MNDTEIANSYESTSNELNAIEQAIRELKTRQRKFKRVLVQHRKMNRIISTLVPLDKKDKGWI